MHCGVKNVCSYIYLNKYLLSSYITPSTVQGYGDRVNQPIKYSEKVPASWSLNSTAERPTYNWNLLQNEIKR